MSDLEAAILQERIDSIRAHLTVSIEDMYTEHLPTGLDDWAKLCPGTTPVKDVANIMADWAFLEGYMAASDMTFAEVVEEFSLNDAKPVGWDVFNELRVINGVIWYEIQRDDDFSLYTNDAAVCEEHFAIARQDKGDGAWIARNPKTEEAREVVRRALEARFLDAQG